MQCFPILNDVISGRCFGQNIDLDVFDPVLKKNQNIMLTIHISDFFQTIKNNRKISQVFQLKFQIWIVYFR